MSHRSGRHFLQIPGPTNVPDRVLRAIDAPTIDHRGPDFARLGLEVLEGLRGVFQTERPGRRLPRLRHRRVGGGARQHAVPRRPRARVRDRPLRDAVARDGRAARARGRAGSRATGATAPTPSAPRSSWPRDPSIAAVMVVHNETSTGVTSRVPEIRAAIDAAGHDALLLVDVDLLARLDRLPPRGVGRRRHRRRLPEGPDAAGRAGFNAVSAEGARGRRARADAALLLGLEADHRGQRDGLLALHVGHEPALRAARGAGDAAAEEGLPTRVRPPRAPRRGDAGGGRGVGPRGAGARPARALRRR